MKIAFIGTGYVGLVTGAVFAHYGYTVYCVDIDEKRIAALKNNEIPFYEPELAELVAENHAAGRLHFTTSYADAVPEAAAIFICVGTPPLPDGSANITYLKEAVAETVKQSTGHTVIAIKSTVPIGVETILEQVVTEQQNSHATCEFAAVPEFLQEGTAVQNTMHPDRLVFGVKSQAAADILLNIHKHISGERIVTDLRTAQMIKYAANSFLAIKVSYANAVATIAERLGADGKTVLYGMGLDNRIGSAYFRPGVGFGGSCLPKDIQAFTAIAQQVSYDFSLLTAAYRINEQQIAEFVEKIKTAVGELPGKTIALLGLSFKPDTDDIREAPSLKIIDALLKAGSTVRAYDPAAMKHVAAKFANADTLIFCDDAYDACKGADAVALITEWDVFKALDFAKIKAAVAQPILLDGRNVYDAAAIQAKGFTYIGVGIAKDGASHA